MKRTCRVLLVDDHEIIRFGVRKLLQQYTDISIIAEAQTAGEGLQKAMSQEIEVVIADIGLPDYTGITLVSQLKRHTPEIKSIVFSTHSEEQYGMRAVLAGAVGYLVKSAHPDELHNAITHVYHGGTWFSDYIRNLMLGRRISGSDGIREEIQLLSARELEVLYMMGQGHSSAEIAINLNRSIKTIDAHREHIKRKLKLRNAAELMRHAVCWVEGQQMDNMQSA